MKKGILILLLLLAAFLLVSCDSEEPTLQNGILIEADTPAPYSEALQARAENAVLALVQGYYEKTVSATLPELTMEKIRAESKTVAQITKQHALSEQQYTALIACVEQNTERILALCTAASGELSEIKALYKELSVLTTPAYVGTTAYRILSHVYDYKYRECMERYEKYGYAFLLADAERLLQEKNTLQAGIGEQGFAEAAKTFFFFAELLEGGALEEDMIASFTDEEILALLQGVDFGMDSITPDGFALLLSYVPTSPEGGYLARLLQAAKENGDAALLAEKMGDALRLLGVCRDKLDVTDCHYVRERDVRGMLQAAVQKFEEKDWALLASVSDIALHRADYDQIAATEFGADYLAYLASVKVCTLDELKQSVGGEDFLKVWKGYVAGICPALAYGMSDD